MERLVRKQFLPPVPLFSAEPTAEDLTNFRKQRITRSAILIALVSKFSIIVPDLTFNNCLS